MSEAMSSVEIEDVLSSIRRLVSEDLRPARRTPVTADEKLLLTPALRIVSDKVAEEVAVPLPALRPVTMPRLHLGGVPAKEILAAKLELAVEAQDIEWESETGDLEPHVAGMEWTDEGWAPVGPTAAQPETRIATSRSAEVESDNEIADSDLLWAAAEESADRAADDRWGDAPSSEDADRAEQALDAELAAALLDGPQTDAPRTNGAAIAAPDGDATFDEQILRDLVRDFIREELQGALGERITRNVRKLVRAEIARAMTAQELD